MNNTDYIKLIKETDIKDLQKIADMLREDLINDVSKTGGHLASNLGVVELTVALYKVFDFPKDKLVWDVGHQCYIHKMISGRSDKMQSLRQFGGISGFPKRKESPFDIDEPGHSSTSVSVALGLAKARDLAKEDYSCIAVIGDGAITGGVAYEGLNHAGGLETPLIVILNDNEMSIGKSVGATANFLTKLRTSDFYFGLKYILKKIKIQWLYNALKCIRDFLKKIFVKDQLFEDLGFKYYGPVDGHNIPALCEELEYIKKYDKPVLLHIKTIKGKGFIPAEENPTKFHGIGKFDKNTIDSKEILNPNSFSEIFGDELNDIAKKDDKVVAISAAMVESTGLSKMLTNFPDRVFDVGIAEQHAVSFAEGLALNGFKPVVAIYSTFLQRAYDEILIEVCLQNLPVVFAIDRAGVTGADGETHQGVFDISYLSAMPNMHIFSAFDEPSLRILLRYALSLNCPCAIRYAKGNGFDYYKHERPAFPMVHHLIDGDDALIITDGFFALDAINALKESKYKVSLVAFEQLKPLDIENLISIIKPFKVVLTIEDGCIIGGFGSEISRIISEYLPDTKCKNIGWPDKFIEHGSIKELRQKYGLDDIGIKNTLEELIEG